MVGYQAKESVVKSAVALVALVFAAQISSSGTRPDKFDPKRDAVKDIREAVAEAKRTGKRVMLDVGGEWCIWCHRLDSLFQQNKDLDEFLHENFVVVKVNYSPENKNEKLLSRYPKVAGYPHLFVLDSEGKLLHSQDTGELESGKHHDRAKVFSFLKQWAPAHVRD
jgi:thioredoxin-related protein